MESDKKDNEKSISERLGINENTNRAALNDLTNNDGSEDPGAELDKEFSNVSRNDNKKPLNSSEDNIAQRDKVATPQQTSGTPPKGEELDAFTNNVSKKDLENTHPKPQAEEILNPKLNSQNDI